MKQLNAHVINEVMGSFFQIGRLLNERRSRLAALALVGFVFSTLVFPARSAQPPEWKAPQKPFRIIGNLYYVGSAGLASFLQITSQGAFLLDGGLPENAPMIVKHITELGFNIHDVKYLLESHAHYDHAGGLGGLKAASGSSARMVASAADAEVLNSGNQTSYGAGWDSHFPPVHVDRTIADGEHLQLGSSIWTAHITPGHTKGCTTWTTDVPENGHTYHVVFYCSTTVPGYPLLHNREYPNIVEDYRHSFAVLKTLPCDVFLANHTGFFNMEEKLDRKEHSPNGPNPFIDPNELQAYVRNSEAEFNKTLGEQKDAAARTHRTKRAKTS